MAYFGITVTLGVASTRYRLWDLVTAVDPLVPQGAASVNIQNDPENTSGVFLHVGDAQLGAARRGVKLGVGDSRLYMETLVGEAPLGALYVWASAGGLVVNLEIDKA